MSDKQSETNNRFERVLHTTLCKDGKADCVKVDAMSQPFIDADNVQQVAFERLMLDGGGHRKGVFFYLFESFLRARDELAALDAMSFTSCVEALTINGATFLLTPDLMTNCSEQGFFRQLISLSNEYYMSDRAELVDFFRRVISGVEQQSSTDATIELLQRLAGFISNRLKKKPGDIASTSFICVLAHCSLAVQALINVSTPDANNPKRGRFYEESLLGNLLSTGALSDPEISSGFFVNPRRLTPVDLSSANQQLWSLTSRSTSICFDIFYAALKSSEDARKCLVKWLASAIEANRSGRNAGFDGGVSQLAFFGHEMGKCSDGFLVNLLAVLAKLALPFSKPWHKSFISINPDYRISCIDFSQDTKMVPSELTAGQVSSEPVPFRADLFYLTHACASCGYRRVVERFFHTAEDLQRTTEAHESVEQGRMQMSPEQFEVLGTRIEMQTRSYLTIRSCLFEPNLCNYLVAFLTSTATWLVAQCLGISEQSQLDLDNILSKQHSTSVALIPELIIENVLEIFLFWKRFHVGINQDILIHLRENAEHVLSFMLVFIGSRERLNNPHLRAKLADLMEVFVVPPAQSSSNAMSSYGSHGFDLSIASNQHRLAAGIIPVVLAVFVSIEMTGQGVNFYEKFSYRRPIYAIIHHCCPLDLHKTKLNALAQAAINDYDVATSDEPPLFLRFVNLLINDAIYLLDEALEMLTKIKQQQTERNAGDWERLAFHQRQHRVQQYDFMVSQCRSLNFLARDTIQALCLVTSLVPTFFTHFSLDDRIAAMANYFLLHLVGKRQGEFKVENKEEVDFKPDVLVQSICSIYVNLGHLEQFRTAVVSDGRSFSKNLFDNASRVLDKIRANIGEIDKFNEVSQMIISTTKQVEDEEAITADAPDEFLDPILGTLMRNPVMLPNSKQIVDRGVIVRHLLSDQFDPFNRDPLSADQLIPMPELKQKIDEWLEERRKQRKEAEN